MSPAETIATYTSRATAIDAERGYRLRPADAQREQSARGHQALDWNLPSETLSPLASGSS
jgi:hypothetical protein